MQEDEEISIDLGKLAFWKKPDAKDSDKEHKKEKEHHKDKEAHQEHHKEQENREQHRKSDHEKRSQEDEDEISIDLGKLAFWKKKKGDKEHKKEPHHKSDEEDDISIDLSKLAFWKRKPKTHKDDGDELAIDIRSVGSYILKHKAVILIAIAIFLTVWFRSYPNNLPATDDWARNVVYNSIRSSLAAEIDRQYPLPPEQRNQLVEQEFQKILDQGTLNIGGQVVDLEQQVQATSNYFKTRFKDDKGYTYLADIDSYVWLRQAENILENGHIGDKLLDGKPFDDHVLAPGGLPVEPSLYPYIEAYLYRILSIFSPNITVMQAAFYTPFLLAIISIIAAFYLARKIAGDVGGFFAAAMVAIHPFFLSRTFGSDTDVVNVVFPLLIVWLFLESFESPDLKKSVALAGLTGVIAGLFAFAWSGWWYVFDFIIASFIIFLAYIIISRRVNPKLKKRMTRKNILSWILVMATFVITSAVFVTIFAGFVIFKQSYVGPTAFLTLKAAAHTSLWPNVYTTVAELNAATPNQVISSMGGRFLFAISLAGILFTLLRKDKYGNVDAKFAILMVIWYVGTIFASLSGVRFILLLVPVFCVSFGVAVGFGYKLLSRWISKSFDISINITKAVVLLLFLLLLVNPLKAANGTAKGEIPIMNDAWHNSLTKIRLESEPDAIINSWWDFGHHFKYVADRAVTFDGAYQNTPHAHWIGRVLLTDDEEEATAILRMLDCGMFSGAGELGSNYEISNFDVIIKLHYDNHTREAVSVLKDVIMAGSEKKARGILDEEGFSEREQDKIMELTYCEPPEDYFITSEDMIGKSGVWAHFGSWDFGRAEMWTFVRGMSAQDGVSYLQEEFGMSDNDARNTYYEIQALQDEGAANSWISPWPSYASGKIGCALVENESITCRYQSLIIVINLTEDYEISIRTPDGQSTRPTRFVYIDEEGKFIRRDYENSTLGALGVTLIDPLTNPSIVLSSPEISTSMFNRLFFLNGEDLHHFRFFSLERSVTGESISVWKISWDGKEEAVEAADEPEE